MATRCRAHLEVDGTHLGRETHVDAESAESSLLQAMEQRILELRESHFSFDGVIQWRDRRGETRDHHWDGVEDGECVWCGVV